MFVSKKIISISLISAFFLLAVGYFSPFNLSVEAKNSETYRQLTLFGDVFQRVREAYVEEVPDKKLIKSAINGMLANLDPHSSFMDDEDFEDMQVQTKGAFGGLGIEVTMEDGFVKVVSPIDDTPADKANIQPGDLIIGIDDEGVYGLTLDEAVEKLRGEIGEPVVITIRRGNIDPFEVKIIRDEIKISSVKSEIFDNIGYIRLTTFSQQTTPGLVKEVQNFKKELGDKFQGIVLDLRNNPGGLLNQSISVTDAFLNNGEIVSTKGRGKSDIERTFAKPGDILENYPLVILINNGSASASEIVAGALKDHGRAIILGTRSFGKGSVQSIIPISNSGAIRLTTSRYYTPSGISIQAKGIEPDIVVEAGITKKKKEKSSVREENLRGALDKKEKDNSNNDNSESLTKIEKLLEDNQISRAYDLIRGIKLYGKKNSLNKKKLVNQNPHKNKIG